MAVELVSIREFAKRIKVDESAVRSAINEGRFKTGYDSFNKKIDVKEAKRDPWVQEQLVFKTKRGVGTKQLLKKLGSDEQGQINVGNNDLAEIQAIIKQKESVDLEMKRLKLAEAQGKLIDRIAVEKVLYTYGHQMKKALEAIPSKVIDNVLAAPSKINAMQIIEKEIHDTLLAFSNGVDLENIAD